MNHFTKCDGNHGGSRCADPECWNDFEKEFSKLGFQYGTDEKENVFLGWKLARTATGAAVPEGLRKFLSEIINWGREFNYLKPQAAVLLAALDTTPVPPAQPVQQEPVAGQKYPTQGYRDGAAAMRDGLKGFFKDVGSMADAMNDLYFNVIFNATFLSESAVFELFRKNCVHYAGNYEVTPGQALRIAEGLYATPQPSNDEVEALRKALIQIDHSISQALIVGNDWRRELALIKSTVDSAIAAQTKG